MVERNKKGGNVKTNIEVEVKENLVEINQGENVRHYRNMRKFSQEYMAAKLNISQSKYSELERSSIIEDKYLTQIAKILDIGLDWLKEVPIQKGNTSYHQDGDGNTNFQNTGDVHYSINNPIEPVVTAYKVTIESLQKTIEAERKEKQEIMDKFVAYVENQKK